MLFSKQKTIALSITSNNNIGVFFNWFFYVYKHGKCCSEYFGKLIRFYFIISFTNCFLRCVRVICWFLPGNLFEGNKWYTVLTTFLLFSMIQYVKLLNLRLWKLLGSSISFLILCSVSIVLLQLQNFSHPFSILSPHQPFPLFYSWGNRYKKIKWNQDVKTLLVEFKLEPVTFSTRSQSPFVLLELNFEDNSSYTLISSKQCYINSMKFWVHNLNPGQWRCAIMLNF